MSVTRLRVRPSGAVTMPILTALALLGGCRPAVELSVAPDGPVFATRQSGGDACLRSLGVYRVSGGQLAWRLGQADPTACATRVTYGEVPRGYRQLGPARPLIPGVGYRVAITGAGFNDAATFTAAPDAFRPPSAAPAGPRSR